MESSQEKSDLRRIAEVLVPHGVEFIVIGGQAETLMGSPRVTFDVDLCYRRTKENLARLATALKELKPTLRGVPKNLPFILDARSLEMGNNFTFDTPIVALDLLGWVEPIGDYEALRPRAKSYPVADMTLLAIDLDDLIRVKQHINRSKDRESLFQLLAIKRILAEQEKE